MKKTHPLALPARARIDLITEGRQASIIRDSLLLTRQAVTQLQPGESVLYINTLTQAAAIEVVADKISARHAAKVCTFSSSARNLMERLELLESTIDVKNVKLVVMNSFEFAAFASRQKTRLALWLREMRDAYGVRIVVYSMYKRQEVGALGTIAWLSDTVDILGKWQHAMGNLGACETQDNPLDAVEEFASMIDSDDELLENGTYLVDRSDELLMFIDEKRVKDPLKYNDLAMVARTAAKPYSEVVVDEEELELELA